MDTHHEEKTPSITASTARLLAEFQKTGRSDTFGKFWTEAQAFVTGTAARVFAKRFVRNEDGSADLAAIDDVAQSVAWKLLELPGKKGRKGWFKLAPQRDPADRLRSWLFNVTRNAAVSYCRKNRMARGGVRMTSLEDLRLTNPCTAEWIMKTGSEDASKNGAFLEDVETRAIVAECVAELDLAMQKLYRLRYIECGPVRKAAEDLGVAASTVSHHEKALRRHVATRLLARGIDSSVLDQPA